MSIYMIIRFFGVIVAVAGPVPYTMTECVQSLSVLTLPQDIPSQASCEIADSRPELGIMTPEQKKLVEKLNFQ